MNHQFQKAMFKLIEERFQCLKLNNIATSDSVVHFFGLDRTSVAYPSKKFILGEETIVVIDDNKGLCEFLCFDIANPKFDPEDIIKWIQKYI